MNVATKPPRTPGVWLKRTAGFLIAAALVLGTWHFVAPRSSPLDYLMPRDELPAVPRSPRPVTLDPAQFGGPAAEGYRIARERPALLEQMPCYCGCYLKDGHQNQLDCFRDRHGETCPMCLQIAKQAAELEDRGYAAEDIKKIIDRRFAPRKP